MAPNPASRNSRASKNDAPDSGQRPSAKNRVPVLSEFPGPTTKGAGHGRGSTDLEWILCDNELEALILENNLIKEHKPPLQHPAQGRQDLPLCAHRPQRAFSRVEVVRRIADDGAKYFGPFF